MASSSVLVDHPYSGVVRIILNRAQSLNAISVDLLDGLRTALLGCTDTRVVLIEGAGDRSFCAGEDLKQTLAPRTKSAPELSESFHKLQDITRLTSSARYVTISAVQGYAIGGGAEIALAADFVIGGPGAKFKFPEVTLGHAATGGITLRLPHIVGLLRAKALLMTGRWVEAAEALNLGMLTEINIDPKKRALELARQLSDLPAIALSSSKLSLERSTFLNMEACLLEEVNAANYCFAQREAEVSFAEFARRKHPENTQLARPAQTTPASPTEATSTPVEGGRSINGQSTVPSVRDINSALAHAARNNPQKPFLRFHGKEVTFLEFETAVGKLAGGLKAADVGPGDRVLVMMQNSIEMVYTWFATNRLGATWVPTNSELKSLTLKHVINAAKAKIAIIDQAMWPAFQASAPDLPTGLYINGDRPLEGVTRLLSELLQCEHPVLEPESVNPATTAAFLYTSGTTGKSKPCILSHEYFILQAQALIDGCGLRKSDVLYCPFPLFHADATALTVIPAILLGATAAISARFSVSRFWDEIRETEATVYDFMGATLALIYKQPPQTSDHEHRVRLAWGVPIPHFAADYERRFNHQLITLYGSVEASLPVFQERGRPRPAGSCGKIQPGHQIRIANDIGEELPANTTGHLLLRSDNPNAFFHGYFNDVAATAAAFAGTWLHTGDLARVDENGNVYYVGRIKDIIRRRGENVNASELEDEFLQHPDVITVAAYGIPSELGDGTEEEIKVAVKMRSNSRIDERALWEWAAARMARFQVPSVIEFVSDIRTTPTGKVDKQYLATDGGRRFDNRSSKRGT